MGIKKQTGVTPRYVLFIKGDDNMALVVSWLPPSFRIEHGSYLESHITTSSGI